MKIPYVDIAAQFEAYRGELLQAVEGVLTSGQYIGGQEIEKFENAFAKLCGTEHAIAVANGTDALILSMSALGIGPSDEVITAPNSWVSSAATIALVGATPVFVDVGADQNMDPDLLELKITERTKAIMPVHLTGKPAQLDPILEVARKHNLFVIEDSAQAVGAVYNGRKCGSMGALNCFSLHPNKNLSACGDAGIITCNDSELYKKVHLLRQHGMPSRNVVELWGYNSRLDAVQAAILNVRIESIDLVITQRRQNADLYFKNLEGLVELPWEAEGSFDTYHLFVIQCDRRNELQSYLEERGVATAIHYPTPLHLQPAAAYLGYKKGDLPVVERQADRILSLPVSQVIGAEQVNYISDQIKKFYAETVAGVS